MSVIAVTGASGYIGGRLVPLLLENGHEVRVLTRRKDALRDVPWRAEVEVIEGDLTDLRAAQELCRGAAVLYYLVHSMGGTSDFAPLEERCAQTIVQAARAEGIERFVYLSGLHPDGELSRHLSSRVRVGEILEASGIPTLTLQAGLIIGSGSASFEMVRHLTDVLPVMPAPHWVLNRVQPIAVRDALHYLGRAAELPPDISGAFDIGGPDAHSYGDMMRLYADAARIRRPVIWPLPVLTPWLAAQWVNLVTPIPRSLAIPLVESLQHDCVMRNRDIDSIIERPEGGLTGYRRAVELALAKMEADTVETTWATAHALESPAEPLPSDPQWAGQTVYTDDRERETTRRTEPALHRDPGDRRGHRLLLASRSLGRARVHGQTGRGSGLAPGQAQPPVPGAWRCTGLVARRGTGARRAVAPACGDARPGPGLVGALGETHSGRQPLQAAGRLLSPRAGRTPLLAIDPAVPRGDLFLHGPQNHHRRGKPGETKNRG